MNDLLVSLWRRAKGPLIWMLVGAALGLLAAVILVPTTR